MPSRAPSSVSFVQMISPLALNSGNSSLVIVPRGDILEARTSTPVSERFSVVPRATVLEGSNSMPTTRRMLIRGAERAVLLAFPLMDQPPRGAPCWRDNDLEIQAEW